MATPSFSLSVSNRGLDFVIGGSGALDVSGVASLRVAIEDGCKNEGASVMLDLSQVTVLEPDAVSDLVKAAAYCRDLGVPFSATVGHGLALILSEAGYSDQLLPLEG